MIQIKFKNLDKSDLIQSTVIERMNDLIQKFPDLEKSKIEVTLEMENSPSQAGRDFFAVKVQFIRGRYDRVRVEKSSPNIYVALAEVVDHLLERLNRFGDKTRVKERRSAREFAKKLKVAETTSQEN